MNWKMVRSNSNGRFGAGVPARLLSGMFRWAPEEEEWLTGEEFLPSNSMSPEDAVFGGEVMNRIVAKIEERAGRRDIAGWYTRLYSSAHRVLGDLLKEDIGREEAVELYKLMKD